MRKRKGTQTDSLDLLLDTICNTFGGVVFIALLIAIMLQTSQSATGDRSADESVAAEAADLTTQVQQLTNEIDDLKQTQASQQELIGQFASTELQEAIRSREKSRRERDALETKRQQLDKEIAEKKKQIEERQETVETAGKRVLDAEHEVASLEAQLEQDRASRTEEIHLPVLKTMGNARQVGLIVRYGRMYVWHRYSDLGTRLGLNTDEFVVTGTENGALITTPLPTAGVKLEQTAESAKLIKKRLSKFDPAYTHVEIVVRPDSYGQFRVLRDVIIEMGFHYHLMPMDEHGVIKDRGGSNRAVQ